MYYEWTDKQTPDIPNDGTVESSAEVDTSQMDTTEADNTQDVSTDAAEDADSGDSSEEEVAAPGKFECISDISDYWNKLYTANEAAINAYEGMPIMELVTPGMCFISGVQYDILNIFNEDGRFEGNLMLAGYPGFEEKKGSQITFGYEYTLEEDSQFSYSKAGDKTIENGNCDLKTGYYFTESYTDRSGDIIDRSTSEFKLQSDKTMCALVIDGGTISYNNEEKLTTSYIFIRAGEGLYDFAVGQSATGTAFDVLKLEDNMTKDQAISAFEAAGATIVYKGGIKDGVFYVE
jgi:hypothetical protein